MRWASEGIGAKTRCDGLTPSSFGSIRSRRGKEEESLLRFVSHVDHARTSFAFAPIMGSSKFWERKFWEPRRRRFTLGVALIVGNLFMVSSGLLRRCSSRLADAWFETALVAAIGVRALVGCLVQACTGQAGCCSCGCCVSCCAVAPVTCRTNLKKRELAAVFGRQPFCL